MLLKKLSRIVPTAAVVVVTLGAVAQPRHASAAGGFFQNGTGVSAFTPANCLVIAAQLNGDQAPTTTCRLAKGASAGVTPDIGSVGCDSSGSSPQLQLWYDAGYTGTELCLFGQGGANLSYWNFNDQMTSWNDPNVNNAPAGKIYKGDNETGASFGFSRNTRSYNVGSGWNDLTNSVCISVYPCP